MHIQSLNHIQLFVTLWTAAHQVPLSIGFPRQEYWSGLPFPPSGHLDNPGMEPESPASPASAGGYFTAESLGKPFGFSTAELPGKPFVWPVPETDYLRQARAGQAFPRRAEKGKERIPGWREEAAGACREARSWAGLAASPAPAPPAERDCRRRGASVLRTTQGVGVGKPQGQAGSSGASDSKLREWWS